ncbi:uncharacterized protein [Dendrobates tinctorius]|uniref:uncharacterized protein n=1 Tax=Dendrobates tinctorius TaxID=92724 RepID=UPI003CCA55D7
MAAAETPPTAMESGHQEDSTSSSGSPPSHRQRLTESQDEEELPEEEGRGGQTPGVGSQLSSQSGARPRGPRSASQGRRLQQRGGHQRPSQRAPDSDGEDGGLDVDHLIDLVREREPLWNMADRRHADLIVTRRLWEEICSLLVDRWEDLDARAQIKERKYIQYRLLDVYAMFCLASFRGDRANTTEKFCGLDLVVWSENLHSYYQGNNFGMKKHRRE